MERYKMGDIDNERFYQVPKSLFIDETYKKMSLSAKMVYALLRDRLELSKRNGWHDDNGDVFLYFNQSEIAEMLNLSRRTIINTFTELKENDLIDIIRQGLTKPNKVYVKKCKKCVSDVQPLRYRSADISRQEVCSFHTNDTEVNETEIIDTEGTYITSGKPDHVRPHSDVATIVEYLNEKAGTNYKSTTQGTISLIKARMEEGFTLEDFRRVIDNKVLDWGTDDKMCKFLRPQTLFSNKFESYLNEVARPPVKRDIHGREVPDLVRNLIERHGGLIEDGNDSRASEEDTYDYGDDEVIL